MKTKLVVFILLYVGVLHPVYSDSLVIHVDFNHYPGLLQNYTEPMARNDFDGINSRVAGEIRGLNPAVWPHITKVGEGALRAHFPANVASGRRCGFLFDKTFPDAEEATMEYRVKFSDGFIWAAGGKLPGLGGSSLFGTGAIPVGCTKNENSILNGFSARLMWRRRGELVVYTYFPNRLETGANCGIDIGIATVESGKWYTIRQYIKLNTPGVSNGILEMYIDGELALRKSDVMYRVAGKPEVKLNSAIFHTYRGGGAEDERFWSPEEEYIWFDDIKVWTGEGMAPGRLLMITADEARGTITQSPDKPVYDLGEEVVLTAVPNAGFRFENWTGDIVSEENPLTIKMDSTIRLSANFYPVYTVSISENTVNGTVDISPEKAYYVAGESITFTPHPAPGYRFGSWFAEGGIGGSTVPLVISINRDIELTAYFDLVTYQLIASARNGVITRNPHRVVYTAGTQVELTATPHDGYQFTEWSGYINSTENPITITMDSTIYITANFDQANSIEQMHDVIFKVYPNPSKGVFTVEIDQNATYIVYNLSGVRLKEGQEYGTFQLDMNGYPKGLYLLEIRTKEGVAVERFVVE